MPQPYLRIENDFSNFVNEIKSQDFSKKTPSTKQEFHLQFKYSLKQSDIINFALTKLKITIYNKVVTSPAIIDTSVIGDMNSQQVIDSILSHQRNVRNNYLINKENIIFENHSDTTAFVNNELLKILSEKKIKENQNLNSNESINSSTFTARIQDSDIPPGINNEIVISTNVVLDKDKLPRDGNVFIIFDLIHAPTKTIAETISKQLNVIRLWEDFKTPKSSPIVNSSFSKNKFLTEVNLSIKQKDEKATGIKIYRSVITPQDQVEKYDLVHEGKLSYGSSTFLKFNHLLSCRSKFKIFSTNYGKTSTSFTEVVPENDFFPLKNIVLSSKINSLGGVMIECRNLTSDITSFSFLMRDLTNNQKDFQVIGKPNLLQDLNTRNSFMFNIENLIDNHVYEFSTKCTFRDFSISQVGSEICTYVSPSSEKLSLNLKNLQVESSEDPSVNFDVEIIIQDSQVNLIKKALENAGNLNYFNGDIDDLKNKLNSILFYQVIRTNLKNGDKENLGIYGMGNSVANFSDKKSSNMFGAKKLEKGCEYRYEISAIIWHPNILSRKENSLIDENGKKYLFNALKWIDPQSIKTGTLISNSFSSLNLTRGISGNVSYIDVNIR